MIVRGDRWTGSKGLPDFVKSITTTPAQNEHGQRLWVEIVDEYLLEDAASLEVLTEACQLLDLSEALAAQIDREVLTVAASCPGTTRFTRFSKT